MFRSLSRTGCSQRITAIDHLPSDGCVWYVYILPPYCCWEDGFHGHIVWSVCFSTTESWELLSTYSVTRFHRVVPSYTTNDIRVVLINGTDTLCRLHYFSMPFSVAIMKVLMDGKSLQDKSRWPIRWRRPVYYRKSGTLWQAMWEDCTESCLSRD